MDNLRKFSSKEELIFETAFWSQILGDHCRFILRSLSPKEIELIEQAVELEKVANNH
jgi:hypothetical protein